MGVRSVCCLSQCARRPRDAPCAFPALLSHEVSKCHRLQRMTFTDYMWSRLKTSQQSNQPSNTHPPNTRSHAQQPLPPDTRSHEKTHAITHDIHQHHVEGAVPSTPHVEGAQQARRLSGKRGLECFHIFFGSSPRRAEARQQAAIGQCLPNAIANLSRQTLMSRLIEGDKGQVRR